jgi:hypothetical protein
MSPFAKIFYKQLKVKRNEFVLPPPMLLSKDKELVKNLSRKRN